jgi:hypothetical protein
MKILVAIKSTGKPEECAHTTFRWAARTGFSLRIFVPKKEVEAYQEGVDDANYHYYLVGRDETETVIGGTNPMAYAKKHGFELVVLLPDNLLDYKTVEDDDKSMVEFATDVASARKEFGLKPDLEQVQLENDCEMLRVL